MFLMQQLENPHSPEESFGLAVSVFRSANKMSQRDFAAKLTEKGMQVDASAVSRIEKGSRSVRLVEALTIAEVLQVDLDLLVSGSRTPSQELSTKRRRTNVALRALEEPITRVAFALRDVQRLLHEHPDLLNTLEDETLPAPENPEAYLDWVATRAERWTVLPEDHVATSTDEEADRIVEVISRLARSRIGPSKGEDVERYGEYPEED